MKRVAVEPERCGKTRVSLHILRTKTSLFPLVKTLLTILLLGKNLWQVLNGLFIQRLTNSLYLEPCSGCLAWSITFDFDYPIFQFFCQKKKNTNRNKKNKKIKGGKRRRTRWQRQPDRWKQWHHKKFRTVPTTVMKLTTGFYQLNTFCIYFQKT